MTGAKDYSLSGVLADANLPSCIALPKPGQSIDDDDCQWLSVFLATVQQMTIFLLHEPAHIDKESRERLAQLVNYARLKAKPDDNFFEALGVPHANMEVMRARKEEELRVRREEWEAGASPERTEEIRRAILAGAEEILQARKEGAA